MRVILAVMLLSLIAACDEVLYEGLSQREANQLVSVLREAGIDAKRVNGQDGTYTVTAAEEYFTQAMRVLEQKGLPRERLESITDVFAADGLLSSPLEERARLAHALSQELTASLIAIDGVVDARIHLTLARDQPLADQDIPATASVLIIHAPELKVDDLIPDVKFLVARGVPDLSYRDVSVMTVAQNEAEVVTHAQPETLRASFLGVHLSVDKTIENQVTLGGLAAAALILLIGMLWLARGRKATG